MRPSGSGARGRGARKQRDVRARQSVRDRTRERGICEHGRQRNQCKECGGLEHLRARAQGVRGSRSAAREAAKPVQGVRGSLRAREAAAKPVQGGGGQSLEGASATGGGEASARSAGLRASASVEAAKPKECGGVEHLRARWPVQGVRGRGLCAHGRVRAARCGGGGICEHGRAQGLQEGSAEETRGGAVARGWREGQGRGGGGSASTGGSEGRARRRSWGICAHGRYKTVAPSQRRGFGGSGWTTPASFVSRPRHHSPVSLEPARRADGSLDRRARPDTEATILRKEVRGLRHLRAREAETRLQGVPRGSRRWRAPRRPPPRSCSSPRTWTTRAPRRASIIRDSVSSSYRT